MRRVTTIDIETLPAEEDDYRRYAEAQGRKAEDYTSTALNGDVGRLLCVGYITDWPDGRVTRGCIGWDKGRQRFHGDERRTLEEFWDMMRGFRPSYDRVVAHCAFDFDLRFIYKRSVVRGVRPSVELSFARYRNTPVFCTCSEWERWGYGAKISLDRLARVLGLPSSKEGGVTGARVFELYEGGEHRAIRDYCLRDVALARAIYRRMVFAEAAAAAPAAGAAA